MKRTAWKTFALLLCLTLCLLLAPAAFADAPGTIIGFDTDEIPASIDLAYKYALIELNKQFPEELTVSLADGSHRLAVTWICLENYDDELDVFHFVPALEDDRLADGVDLPVITVNILGKRSYPVLPEVPARPFSSAEGYSSSDSAAYNSSDGITYYNVFEQGKLPPVRNQGNYSSCWAFSTISAIEADLIHDGNAGTDIDLSELHLSYFTYHGFHDEKNLSNNDTVSGPGGLNYLEVGGSPYYAGKRLASLVGPVSEASVPYTTAAQYAPSAEDGRLSGPAQISGIYYLNTGDIPSIKDAIMEHGAVSAVFNAKDNNYSATYNSYYYPTEQPTNHVIALVGWDDSFSKEHFKNGTPSNDGAWLVRNSWGENKYDYKGYFWLSYYDKSLGWDAYAFDAQPWQYEHCYAYDGSVNLSTYGTIPSNRTVTQYFMVDGSEQIEAIGIETDDYDITYNFTVSCAGESSTASASFSIPGYYLVPLSQPLPIARRAEVKLSYTCSKSFHYTVEEQGVVCGYTYTPTTASKGVFITGYTTLAKDPHIKLFSNNAFVPVPEPDLILPADLTAIGAEAFANGSFTSVKIPGGVKSIASRAFADCGKLTWIVFADGNLDVAEDFIAGCPSDIVIEAPEGSTVAANIEKYRQHTCPPEPETGRIP